MAVRYIRYIIWNISNIFPYDITTSQELQKNDIVICQTRTYTYFWLQIPKCIVLAACYIDCHDFYQDTV